MAKAADISTKRLISLAPEDWVKWAPILKGGTEEATIQSALQILRADEKLSQLETVMAFFATFVLDSALVQQIMRWDMAILRESSWYEQILQEGEKRGILSGIELGLEFKFGAEGLQLMTKISQISDLEKLKTIQRGILTLNTLDELHLLIQSIQTSST